MSRRFVTTAIGRFLADDFAAIDPELPAHLRLLVDRGAERDWHKHGTFKDHLLGVYRILTLWGQPRATRLCGLFHSVYSNEYVDLALFDPRAGRGLLRDRLGADVEELVYLFCTMPRSEFAVELLNGGVPAAGLVLRYPDGRKVALSRDQVATFLVVTLADLAEQWFGWQDEVMAGYPQGSGGLASDHWSAALWPGPLRPTAANLSLLSRLAALVPGLGVEPPPIFDRCTRVLAPADEAAACALYWQVVTRSVPLVRAASARECLLAAVEHNAWLPEPHLLLAQLSLIAEDYAAAERHAARGLELLCAWGTPWDKRVSWAGWVAWARLLLQKARQRAWPATLRAYNNLGLVAGEAAGNEAPSDGRGP